MAMMISLNLKKNVMTTICELIDCNGKLNLLPKIKKSLSKSKITFTTKLKELEFIAKKIVKLNNIQDVHDKHYLNHSF